MGEACNHTWSGGTLLEVWRGGSSEHALLILLVLFLLLKHLLGTTNAAPVNRTPPVPHHLLHILRVNVRRACGPKVVHHLCMLLSNILLT